MSSSSSSSSSVRDGLGKTYKVNPSSSHTATVIFFHGLGDTGAGWLDAIEMFSRTELGKYVKFVLPTAPTVPVTLNFGMRMPAWFDIFSLEKDGKVDEAGILKAKKIVEAFIEEEIAAGIDPSRIVIGGFSQGGAISLFGALGNHKGRLAGVIGLSCFLPMRDQLLSLVDSEHKKTPVLMGHGSADPLVSFDYGLLSSEFLKKNGFEVDFRTYKGMAHSACPQEIDDVTQFLKKRLPPK
eukprot:CAMPEP_0201480116 /NCGR_PEP_ID=MMETSP0151_2-20130828/4670_1 /ASSEMBLY_ACC=CAM_ASM_000257 /TAXON_ID=200890 /ORGANISM="Paramoeba atlantica, Strain 621/1 / CCAP 1560/9" /LENGTH=238 /DNA_ID=CAMNT_0047861875 /DNA_START=179 /DNA_END=895 /DNA_ORIENTATION=-